jgi:hypothetical protein
MKFRLNEKTRFCFVLGELLLEWITLNSDSRNSNTQALIEQVKSCLQPISNNSTNLNKV